MKLRPLMIFTILEDADVSSDCVEKATPLSEKFPRLRRPVKNARQCH